MGKGESKSKSIISTGDVCLLLLAVDEYLMSGIPASV